MRMPTTRWERAFPTMFTNTNAPIDEHTTESAYACDVLSRVAESMIIKRRVRPAVNVIELLILKFCLE